MFDSLISIIVPVYNRQETLSVCIESILKQEYTKFELILVDDGSADSSLSICNDYAKKDKRIRVVHQHNQGVSTARNVGISNANGEWLTFVDSDDALKPNHLTQLTIYGENSDLVMVNRCWGSYIDGEFSEVGNSCVGLESRYVEGYKEIIDYLFGEHEPYKHCICSSVDKFYKRQLVDRDNLSFDTHISFGEDQIFVLKYLRHCHTFAFSNVGTYILCPCQHDNHLGAKVRLPEEYRRGFQANYDILKKVAVESKSKLARDYSMDYLVDRLFTRILYRYLQPRMCLRYSVGKLYKFAKLQYLPMIFSENIPADVIRDKRVAKDYRMVMNGHLVSFMFIAFLRESLYWFISGIKRRF